MGNLNFSDYPERREQASANVKPTTYSLLQINASVATSFVAKAGTSGWTAATGTADRGTFATYTAPTISAVPTQAEVQAVADAVQVLSRHMKALIDDLKANSTI